MRATSIIAAAVGAALIGVSAGADAQSARNRVHTDIPPEALGPALRSLAQEFGFQIVYPSKDIAALRTPGVSGSFTLEEALEHALAGTGLTYRYVDLHTITILPISRAAAVAADDPPAGAPEHLALATGTRGRQASGNRAGERAGDPAPADPPQAAGASANTNSGAGGTSAVPTLQEVVVTGTSIRGGNAQTALPVQILSTADIARTGATSVPQLMQEVSAVSSVGSTTAAQGTGFTTGGLQSVSLHGLGATRTLVLINGLRSSAFGGNAVGEVVDIGAIPVAAIQRVEILKDGASAVYGSDAIAGVVNFILKSDFQGIDASATVGTPTQAGGGTEETASIYAGLGSLENDRYNIGIGLSYDHSSPIMGSSRSYASRYNTQYGNDVTSVFAFPANVAIPAKNSVYPKGSIRSPMAGNCGPYSLNDQYLPTQCRFDNSPYDSLEPLQKRLNVYVNGAFELTPATELYGNALFSQTKQTTWTQPVPLGYLNPMVPGDPYIAYLANLLATQYPNYHNPAVKPGNGAFLLGPNSPYYPTAWAAANGLAGQPLNLIYRGFATGLRQTLDIADTTRVVGGARGDVAGWHYDTSLLYSGVNVSDNLQSGWPLYSKLMPLLDSGVINPFGPTTDPSAAAAAMATNYIGEDYSTRTSLTSLDATASRKIADLPAGPLRAAVGGEIRRETFEFSPSAALKTGDISGLGGNQIAESFSRAAQAAYVELSGNIIHSLGADVAVRWDHYQQIGSTVNPQLSLHWQALHWLLLRGSAGTGFRAPSLTDLYTPQVPSVTSNGTRDPIKCPTFDPNNPSCSFQFQTLTGGNPNLKPEKSTNYTLGMVLRPVRNLTVDLDSYWIYLRDSITPGGLSYNVILQNAQTATQFASYITRDASGNIVFISQTNANLFKTYVSGLDINLDYDFPVGPGYVMLRGNGSYYYKYDMQNFDGTWTSQINIGNSQAGAGGGVIVRWRHALTLGYTMPSWNISVTQNYQEPYLDTPSTITRVPRYVSAYDTFDLQGSYTGLRHLDFTLGVKNLANRNPPYANYGGIVNNFVGGYDLSYGDPRGRYVYATVRYTIQ
jgi:iron complex outermembrane receptor protein